MDYMTIPCGLGEGFLEFCGSQGYDVVDNSYYMYSTGHMDGYDNMPPFQHDDFMPSPESDQENYIDYYDHGISDYHDVCGNTPRPKKMHQRKAANMRERRRMKSINDAFDHLRKRIPAHTPGADRRISKVDTLRLAIQYISYLGELIKKCSDSDKGPNSRNGATRDKIILRCKSDFGTYGADEGQPLIGHSLSWSNKDSCMTGSSTLSAKIWMPQKPTPADMKNLMPSASSFFTNDNF